MTVRTENSTALLASTAALPTQKAPSPALHARVMIVDDEPLNTAVVRKYMELEGYTNFITTHDATSARGLIERENPDIILLDIMMPNVSGLDILKELRSTSASLQTPVIILTASTDQETKQRALDLGATDFLTKPVDPSDLLPRVRNALLIKEQNDQLKDYAATLERRVDERTHELARTRLEIIHCLARAAEYRDNETGYHVIRVGRYVGIIARALSLDEARAQIMEHAAPLHDVGKIGVPDSILLKPGRLTPDEFGIMKTHSGLGKRVFECISDDEWNIFRHHADIGAKILGGTQSELLTMAARIAITHHERWDGTGYPLALEGINIPLEGRITAVADVFDALSSERPYKPAFPLKKCLDIMEEGRGTHFDPDVLDAFLANTKEIVAVQIEFADTD